MKKVQEFEGVYVSIYPITTSIVLALQSMGMNSRERVASAALNLQELKDLIGGLTVTLFHGTTAEFTKFDLSYAREDLVDQFYGRGIFLTPSRSVASRYARANRNYGLPKSLLTDLPPKVRPLMLAFYEHGRDGWNLYTESTGLDFSDIKEAIGVDPNDIADIAGYIEGSKYELFGSDDSLSLFNESTGRPGWVLDSLAKIGVDPRPYTPKVYTVTASCENPLVTRSKSEARSAPSRGYDCTIFHGPDLVGGVPEVVFYDPSRVKIIGVDYLDD